MTNVTHSRLVRMSIKKVDGPQDHHRFIDEAGDMTFHSGKRGRKTSSIGMDGVSRCFMIGLVHVKSPLDDARATIDGFCEEINSSKFFQSFPSVQKRTKEGWHGFYPHASKDPAELRYEFLKLMAQEIDFSARVVVGRKIPAIYQQRHNEQPREFYADNHVPSTQILREDRSVDSRRRGTRQQHIEPQPSACRGHRATAQPSRHGNA